MFLTLVHSKKFSKYVLKSSENPQSQNHRFNWWFALPLKRVIAVTLSPKRDSELYYPITRTATRERVLVFFLCCGIVLSRVLTSTGLA